VRDPPLPQNSCKSGTLSERLNDLGFGPIYSRLKVAGGLLNVVGAGPGESNLLIHAGDALDVQEVGAFQILPARFNELDWYENS
jgi:hypothetical protein